MVKITPRDPSTKPVVADIQRNALMPGSNADPEPEDAAARMKAILEGRAGSRAENLKVISSWGGVSDWFSSAFLLLRYIAVAVPRTALRIANSARKAGEAVAASAAIAEALKKVASPHTTFASEEVMKFADKLAARSGVAKLFRRVRAADLALLAQGDRALEVFKSLTRKCEQHCVESLLESSKTWIEDILQCVLDNVGQDSDNVQATCKRCTTDMENRFGAELMHFSALCKAMECQQKRLASLSDDAGGEIDPRWRAAFDDAQAVVRDAESIEQSIGIKLCLFEFNSSPDFILRTLEQIYDVNDGAPLDAFPLPERVSAAKKIVHAETRGNVSDCVSFVQRLHSLRANELSVHVMVHPMPDIDIPKHLQKEFFLAVNQAFVMAMRAIDRGKQSRMLQVDSLLKGKTLAICFSDNGRGLAENGQANGSAQKDRLKMLERIARRNGWLFDVESSPGVGNRVTLWMDTGDWRAAELPAHSGPDKVSEINGPSPAAVESEPMLAGAQALAPETAVQQDIAQSAMDGAMSCAMNVAVKSKMG